jgi:hypothetical protein
MSTKLEVAKRYAGSRPGFELVIAEDVGIPYFELRMQVLVQREKNIGPIDEFVLGSVKRGIDTVPEVMRFLGLDQLVVEQAIVDLCKTDLLDYQVGTNGNAFHLTELGKNAYQSLVELVPDRLEIKLGFDRLIWQPSSRHDRALIRPRDAKSRELIELPPVRKRRLTIEELDIVDTERELKQRPDSILQRASLVGIQDFSCYRKFLPGVALLFVNRDSGEQQTAITIDGRISETHETSFASIDGPKRVALIADDLARRTDEAPNIPPEARRLSIERSELDALVERQAQELAAGVGESRTETADSDITGASTTGDQQNAEGQLESYSVRPLQTYEHQTVLQEALEGSERRLLIISPWIRNDVVNDGFVEALWGLARKRVEIHIGYGIGGDRNNGDQDEWALQLLERLANENSNVTVKRLGNTHAKILVSDDRLVVTSFNWLSFRGTRRRRYRQEEGMLIEVAQMVEAEYERYRGLF